MIDKDTLRGYLEKLKIGKWEVELTHIPGYLMELAKEFTRARSQLFLNDIQYAGTLRTGVLTLYRVSC